MSLSPHQLLSIAALLLAALASVSDLRQGLISNRLVLAGGLLGLVGRCLLALQLAGAEAVGAAALVGVLGVVACGLLPIALYAARGLGGGDVKLLMALGALLGPLLGLEAQLYTFVCGGLYAFGLLAYRGVLLRTVASSVQLVGLGLFSRRVRERQSAVSLGSLRFAPAIFAGTALAVLSHWSAS